MRPDGKGGYFLLGGREDALVTPEALRQANDAHMASAACSIVDSAAESTAEGAVEVGGEQSSTSSPLSYNEISTDLCGIRGIRAIFVRAAKRESVLLAMGIRSLIQHCFPWLSPLPLMLLTPQSGALPIPRRTQLAVLRAVSKSCVDAGGADSPAVCGLPVEPRIPVDVAEFPELSLKETLRLHARYGVSKSSLDALFRDVVSSSTNAPQALARYSSTAIADAIANNNAASAREVVRSAAPLMVRAASVAVAVARSEPEPSAALTPSELIKLGTAVPHRLYAELGEMQLAEENSGVESDTALAACAAPLARSVHASRDALVALGAQVMLREFVAGKVAPRLRAACDQLGAWLTQAQQPSCGALLFLVRSWREICKVEPDSQLTTFLSGKAVVNRARFRAELQRLRDAKDGLQYISMLYELVSRLHRPCLRLRVLQQVLGLDERFSREIVFGVVCLAHDIVDRMETPEANALDAANVDQCCGCYGSSVEMGRRASYPEAGATPNCGGQVQLQRSRTLPAVLAPPQDRTSLTNLIDFDEAIHLEAEIILGPTSVKSHTSDPLGDEWRRYRMLSGFRH
uniref:Uncharacterized protein n=2 Tax=Chrysotila carterae TaxID=13221 RepID=A0A7S4BMW9_CHRCT